MRDERAYEILNEFIEIFINFNDKLYEKIMKKKYDEKFKRRIKIYSSRLSSSVTITPRRAWKYAGTAYLRY